METRYDNITKCRGIVEVLTHLPVMATLSAARDRQSLDPVIDEAFAQFQLLSSHIMGQRPWNHRLQAVDNSWSLRRLNCNLVTLAEIVYAIASDQLRRKAWDELASRTLDTLKELCPDEAIEVYGFVRRVESHCELTHHPRELLRGTALLTLWLVRDSVASMYWDRRWESYDSNAEAWDTLLQVLILLDCSAIEGVRRAQ